MIDFYVLGSGISGSSIANLLGKKYSTEVIDKAKGVGGRSSIKKLDKLISFDHGLQYFYSKDLQFKKYLNKLIQKKILKIWEGNHLDFTFKQTSNYKKIIGIKGNNDINKYLLKNIKKNLNQEIIDIRFKKNYWEISANNKKFNSRNLIVTFPFEQTKKIAKKYLSKDFLNLNVKMHPNITLLLKQKSNKKIPISSMKFKNKIISWAANENSKKRFISNNNYWTIQASQDYSNKNISLYKKSKYRCSKKILNEFSRVIGLKPKDFEIFRIHGWKYSFSKVKTGQKYFWNKKYRLGICGDWFIGPNAESSWKSALALYDKIKKNPSSKTKRV